MKRFFPKIILDSCSLKGMQENLYEKFFVSVITFEETGFSSIMYKYQFL